MWSLYLEVYILRNAAEVSGRFPGKLSGRFEGASVFLSVSHTMCETRRVDFPVDLVLCS